MSRPFARATGHSQALYKGDRLRSGLLQGPSLARVAPAASSQGAAPTRGQPVRGSGRVKPTEGRRPQRRLMREWRPPAHEVPPEGSGTYRRGDRQWRVALLPTQGRRPKERGSKG
ncbi:hypothetical protein BHM03_00052562 [Ensete ventricosum]|nr:hypothetical protein BHM03_00052562 [Ensete ventricosum]